MNGNLPTILHIEDDSNDRLLLQLAAQQAGVRVHIEAVKDGEGALAYLKAEGPYADRARHPFPNLILLDLKLPRKSGFEVLSWLRAQPETNAVPVVVLSASEQPSDIQKVLQTGGDVYFVKPLAVNSLVEIVKEIQRKWL